MSSLGLLGLGCVCVCVGGGGGGAECIVVESSPAVYSNSVSTIHSESDVSKQIQQYLFKSFMIAHYIGHRHLRFLCGILSFLLNSESGLFSLYYFLVFSFTKGSNFDNIG